MSKTITLTDEQFDKVKKVLAGAETKEKPKAKTVIYKIDGSVLYESDKATVKEALVEAVDKGADLRDVDLVGADLRGVDLEDADLKDADLKDAYLVNANLGGANLGGANLRGADLGGAYLGGADFYNTKFYGRDGNTKIRKNQVEDFLTALGVVVEE